MTYNLNLPRCPRAPIYAAIHNAAPGVLADNARWEELNRLLDSFGVDRAARGLPEFDREDAPVNDEPDVRQSILAAISMVAVPDLMNPAQIDDLLADFGIPLETIQDGVVTTK